MAYPILVLLWRVRFYFYFIFRLRTSLIVSFGPLETCSNKQKKKQKNSILDFLIRNTFDLVRRGIFCSISRPFPCLYKHNSICIYFFVKMWNLIISEYFVVGYWNGSLYTYLYAMQFVFTSIISIRIVRRMEINLGAFAHPAGYSVHNRYLRHAFINNVSVVIAFSDI